MKDLENLFAIFYVAMLGMAVLSFICVIVEVIIILFGG